MKGIRLIILLFALAAIPPAKAQQRLLPPVAADDSTATAALLTCAPGADIYSLEGHSGLRLRYGTTDVVANWGMFDFNAPHFVYRFVKGETDYSIGVCPTEYFLLSYAHQQRRVTQQTLNLTPGQVAALVEAVDRNLQPENRIYRYNYVRDNCATRPLKLIENAIGAEIVLTQSPAQAEKMSTFRNEMRYFHKNYLWYQFGIDICRGSGLDQEIDSREMMFAPVILEELAATARIGSGPRSGAPLVTATEILADGPADGPILGPTPWYQGPVAAIGLLLLITILLTIADRRKNRVSRWFDFLLFGIFGIMGCVVAFLVFISVHEASSPNWLLTWMNPLCLIVPLTVYIRKARKITGWFHLYNITATTIFFIIAATGVQSINPALLLLAGCGLIRSINFTLNATSKDR